MKYNKFRDASNRLTISFDEIPSFLYWWYKRKLVKKFHLVQENKMVKDVDTKFQTFILDGNLINIEWDNWNGFSIVALDKNSEPLLLEFLEYLRH